MRRQKKFYAWGYADEDLSADEIAPCLGVWLLGPVLPPQRAFRLPSRAFPEDPEHEAGVGWMAVGHDERVAEPFGLQLLVAVGVDVEFREFEIRHQRGEAVAHAQHLLRAGQEAAVKMRLVADAVGRGAAGDEILDAVSSCWRPGRKTWSSLMNSGRPVRARAALKTSA